MGLKENKELYQSLKESKKLSALSFLAIYVTDKKIIKAVIERDPTYWWTLYHFHWGMAVRNALREVDYGEEYFGIGNLDDIYIELVEDMINETY